MPTARFARYPVHSQGGCIVPETKIGSTVPRRQLGRELRKLREEEARIAQVDAARRAGVVGDQAVAAGAR